MDTDFSDYIGSCKSKYVHNHATAPRFEQR